MSLFPARKAVDRYFGSVRDLLLVRLDPGTSDDYLPRELRVETLPTPVPDVGVADFSTEEGTVIVSQLETGPKALSQSSARAALFAAQRNLADVVEKSPIPVDSLSMWLDLQPERSRRSINSFRAADEVSFTLNYQVPLDPRVIRSVLCFHYEGTTSANDYAEGVLRGEPEDVYGSASDRPLPTSIVPATPENLRWVGMIDEVQATHGDNGSRLEFRGRDLTGLLLDEKIPPRIEKRISPGATILEVVSNLLKTNPAFGLIRGPFLRAEPGFVLPRLDPKRYSKLAVSARDRNRASRSGDDGNVTALIRSEKGQGDETYWDAIVGLCVSHALIPYIEIDALYLTPPRTLFAAPPNILSAPGNRLFPMPGTTRAQLEPTERVRRMVYGQNVSELRFSRKMGRIKAPAVEVSAPAPDDRRRLQTVEWPPQKTGKTGAHKQADTIDPTGRNPRTPVHRVVLQYVADESQLLDIAKQVYETMGRQEVGISFSTSDIASWSDHPDFDPNTDPDLLRLAAGDPIRILVRSADRRSGLYAVSELNTISAQVRREAGGASAPAGRSSAMRLLRDLGFEEETAQTLLSVLASANLPDVFRVNGAEVTFDSNGFRVSIDARDYVRVRSDPAIASPGVVEFSEEEAFVTEIVGGVVNIPEEEAFVVESAGVVSFSEEEAGSV